MHNEAWSALNYRENIIRRVQKQGYSVKVAAAKLHKAEEKIAQICPFLELKHLDLLSLNPVKEVRLLIELFLLYFKERPDLIMHYTVKPNTYGNIAARALGIPSISTVNGLGRTFSKKG